jgi:hypothetical protein
LALRLAITVAESLTVFGAPSTYVAELVMINTSLRNAGEPWQLIERSQRMASFFGFAIQPTADVTDEDNQVRRTG